MAIIRLLPRFKCSIDTAFSGPVLPMKRKIASSPCLSNTGQGMRDLGAMKNEYYALSSLRCHPNKKDCKANFEIKGIQKRWSTYFSLEGHYKLIHSGISNHILEKLYSIDETPFKFVPKGIIIDDDNALSILKEQSFKASILDDVVFIDSKKEGLEDNEYFVNDLESLKLINKGAEESSFRIHSFNYNRYKINIDAKSPGFLHWVDGYDNRWKAEVNGVPVEIFRSNVNFKSIKVPKGRHEVLFEYRPMTLIWGLWFFYGSFFGGLSFYFFLSFKERRLRGLSFFPIGVTSRF